jgi:uncharacterized membrane protein
MTELSSTVRLVACKICANKGWSMQNAGNNAVAQVKTFLHLYLNNVTNIQVRARGIVRNTCEPSNQVKNRYEKNEGNRAKSELTISLAKSETMQIFFDGVRGISCYITPFACLSAPQIYRIYVVLIRFCIQAAYVSH